MQRNRLGCAAVAWLALFDGDPFEYVTHVCAVVMDGDVGEEGCR
jgi:hypothetical protein